MKSAHFILDFDRYTDIQQQHFKNFLSGWEQWEQIGTNGNSEAMPSIKLHKEGDRSRTRDL